MAMFTMGTRMKISRVKPSDISYQELESENELRVQKQKVQ